MTALSLAEQTIFASQFPLQYLNGVANCRVAYRHIYHSPIAQKLMVLVNGRAENMLKWTTIAHDFYQQGYDVLMFDHRGQGYSERLLTDKEKGYVDNFAYYAEDMYKILKNLTALYPYPKQYLLAHSLGGLISAHFLAKYENEFQKAVFCAPFFGIPYHSPKRDQFLVRLMLKLGKGENYVFGKKPYAPVDPHNNKLSHDAQQMVIMNQIIKQNPDLKLGGPTFQWLNQCEQAINQLPQILPKIAIPVLILQAEQEAVVNNKNLSELTALFSQMEHHIIEGSKHEILFEREIIKTQAWQKIHNWFN